MCKEAAAFLAMVSFALASTMSWEKLVWYVEEVVILVKQVVARVTIIWLGWHLSVNIGNVWHRYGQEAFL